ncbi:MAG: YdeI/OmpD-associated family protein [Candidatus Dojkabacteria bacterium]
MKNLNTPEKIHFKAKLQQIDKWTILRLDKEASSKLSTRGLAMIEGTINGLLFQTAVEPDGKKGHWFEIEKGMQQAIHAQAGDTVDVVIEQSRDWSEPKVPSNLKEALTNDSKAETTWGVITPFARWEWIRWIGATKNPETIKKRIGVALSKLGKGDRRPCCFNSNQCTVPYLSHNGVLLESEQTSAIKVGINKTKSEK